MWLITSVGFPLLIALVAGEKPILFGVLSNSVTWCALVVLAILDPFGIRSSHLPVREQISYLLMMLSTMIGLSLLACVPLELLDRCNPGPE